MYSCYVSLDSMQVRFNFELFVCAGRIQEYLGNQCALVRACNSCNSVPKTGRYSAQNYLVLLLASSSFELSISALLVFIRSQECLGAFRSQVALASPVIAN